LTELKVGDQAIRYDREATEAIYNARTQGFAEKCGCAFCRNFAAQREKIYPQSFRALLEEIGIDPNTEDDNTEYGPTNDGCHSWGGWFYFVGQMAVWGEQNSQAPDAPEFQFFFTTTGPGAISFPGRPLLGIEFTTHLRWILPEDPDLARRRAGEKPIKN
jgi:hypothetical protein